MRSPDAATRGSYGQGVLIALAGSVVVHPSLALLAYLLGRPHVTADQAVWFPMILVLTPGVTGLVWVPVAAFLVRDRTRTLQALLVCAGLVFLLNGACWGVLVAG